MKGFRFFLSFLAFDFPVFLTERASRTPSGFPRHEGSRVRTAPPKDLPTRPPYWATPPPMSHHLVALFFARCVLACFLYSVGNAFGAFSFIKYISL